MILKDLNRILTILLNPNDWTPDDFYGIHWILMESNGYESNPYDLFVESKETYGISWILKMLWHPYDFDGMLTILQKSCGFLWNQKDSIGIIDILMESLGF